ncbi:MAG TPA: [LysW]-aminoadipate kinase [Candidatus Binatia bacterium]|nr:[LysW]-aminoadipate kinase [Candidatus Binatia bacterium]
MIIIKIGGGRDVNLKGVVQDLASLTERFIIVHGANAVRDEIAAKMGHPTRSVTSVSGYASVLSDEKAIDAIMMGYAGIQNKRLVELCQQRGINAVGLSGLDGKLVQGARNKGIRVRQNEKTIMMRDFSGKPKQINQELIALLLDHGYVPVICIPIIDENNFAINSENDDIVAVLQESLHADTVVQLIEAPGFMDDINDDRSLVPAISRAELDAREAQVEGRMKRKMLALKKLMENGAARVIISDGRVEHPVQDALSGKGTIIQ